MKAIGVDLGGTKIETRVFDDRWAVADSRRIPTPRDYDGLVRAVADQIAWAQSVGGQSTGGQSTGGRSGGGQTMGGPSTGGQSGGGQTMGGPSTGGQSTRGQSGGGQTMGGQCVGGKTGGGQSGGGPLPVGVAAAGHVDRRTGLAIAANLPASGRAFPADIAARTGDGVSFVTDARAFTLSEAVFGPARGRSAVLGVVLGTGVGGGVVIDGALIDGPGGFAGEVGHVAAPAHLVVAHGLPLLRCGCGRTGCAETLIAGPGLSRIAMHVTGHAMTPPEIVAARPADPGAARVWEIWCALVAELLLTLTLTVDPDCIVLGGGLSLVPGVTDDLSTALAAAQLGGLPVPHIVAAQGGETSGARGAAYAAWRGAGGAAP
jgi:N-acetylglucosamine kinase